MKPPVVVTLILMGTVLILAPIGADYLFQHNMTAMLLKPQMGGTLVIDHLGSVYRVACWFTGSLMIAVGILGGIGDSRSSYYIDSSEEDDEDEDEDDKR